jgi:hypothetical protein
MCTLTKKNPPQNSRRFCSLLRFCILVGGKLVFALLPPLDACFGSHPQRQLLRPAAAEGHAGGRSHSSSSGSRSLSQWLHT